MDVFNVKEVAEYLHCSVSTIRKLVRANQIPYFRIGNRLLFNKNYIENWVCSQLSKNLVLDNERL